MTKTEYIEIEEGILPGTTWASVQKIVKSGISTVGDLARQTPSQLAEQSGVGQDTCDKYIGIALDMITEGYITGAQLWDKMQNRRKLTTGSQMVDEILRSDDERERGVPGGIEECTITEVGGKKGDGKTQLMHMLAVNAQLPLEEGGLDGCVMWIDTENTFRPDRILEICKNRGLDGNKTLGGIYYEEVYSSKHQQKIVGELPKRCHDLNIKIIIIDSMMALLRSEYRGRGTLAERQQVLGDIVQRLKKISQSQNLIVIYTNQVMDKPDGYGDQTEAVGGNILGHISTLKLFIRRGRTDYKTGISPRIMKVMKSPYLPENEAPFVISDYGIEDVDSLKERLKGKGKKEVKDNDE